MKKWLCLLVLGLVPSLLHTQEPAIASLPVLDLGPRAEAVEVTAYRGAARVAYSLRLRSPSCFFFQQQQLPYPQQAGPDATTIALLTRIADQQAAMATQMMLLNQQNRQVPFDNNLAQTLQSLALGQERVIAALQAGRVTDPALVALLNQMVSGQQSILATIQGYISRPLTPPAPPIVIAPPAPIVVTPPSGGLPPAGGHLQPLPGVGGQLQVLPGPGGSLQLIPPAGGSLQALPGPGGSIQVLPGGVMPPLGTPPSIPPAGGTPGLPPAGGIPGLPPFGSPMTPLPGAGDGIQIIPVGPLVPHRYSVQVSPASARPYIDARLLPRR